MFVAGSEHHSIDVGSKSLSVRAFMDVGPDSIPRRRGCHF